MSTEQLQNAGIATAIGLALLSLYLRKPGPQGPRGPQGYPGPAGMAGK